MKPPVFLITGALTSVGRATAFAAASAGYRVVIAGWSQKMGKELEFLLRATGCDAIYVQTDVTDEDSIRNLMEVTTVRFGRLDAAFNNAGAMGLWGRVVEQNSAGFDAVFRTNVLGTLLSMKHEILAMRNSGGGSIINVVAESGIDDTSGSSVVAASRQAVECLTRAAAFESEGDGIRINAIAVRYRSSQMKEHHSLAGGHPSGVASGEYSRYAGRIAKAVIALASEKGPGNSGHTLPVEEDPA